MKGRRNLIGEKFNLLEVKSQAASKNKNRMWNCLCDCGCYTIISTDALGRTKSCGCLQKKQQKNLAKTNTTHGLSYENGKHTRLYNIWSSMKDRCYNKNSVHYKKWYGSRGITICSEWKNDYETFHKWAMDNGYQDDLTIERINNNGNYELSNCKWIPQSEQLNNYSNNVLVEVDGVKITLMQASIKIGINYKTIHNRISKLKWDVQKALSTPTIKKSK